MKYCLFAQLYNEAKEYNNIDMYIGERGWQSWMDTIEEDKIVTTLNKIFELSKKSTAEIVKEYKNLNKESTLGDCGIPYRTLQNWSLGVREPSPYVICLIAYALYESSEN